MSGTGPSAAAPDGPSALDEEAYATRIEDAFIAVSGSPYLASPKDWALIRGWLEGGIPVDTVVRAIEETFEKRRGRGSVKKVGTIAYCAGAVEERWELERRALVGQGETTRDAAPEGVAPRLERLAAALTACATSSPPARKAIDRTLEKLRDLDPTKGFDQLEDELAALEAGLVRKLARTLDPADSTTLAARVVDALGETPGVTAEGRERIRRALEAREVRRTFALPALTLFDV